MEYTLTACPIFRDHLIPMLGELIEKVLEYLRANADHGNAECPYGEALSTALELATLTDDERNQIDLSQPVSTWPLIGPIKD